MLTRMTEQFGVTADGVWSAPGRINLIGEHTDYNDGLALPIALPRRTVAAVRRRPDGLLRMASTGVPGEPVTVLLDEVRPGTPGGWAAYVAGVFWALDRAGYAVSGADVVVSSDVPLGAGMSSSAALECAVGAAISDLEGLDLLADDTGRAHLAQLCRRAENDIAGAPTGGMDQSAAMLCRPGHALLLDCRDGATRLVPFDLAAHGLELLVIDTKARHALVDGQYAARRADCTAAARALEVTSLREVSETDLAGALERLADPVARRRVRHVVTEIARVPRFVAAFETGDMAEAGRLMVASHASLRDDFEVSCPELELAVEGALREGALGARMTGGGFGGCAIALVPSDRAAAIADTVTAAFARADFVAPQAFRALASGSARRDT